MVFPRRSGGCKITAAVAAQAQAVFMSYSLTEAAAVDESPAANNPTTNLLCRVNPAVFCQYLFSGAATARVRYGLINSRRTGRG